MEYQIINYMDPETGNITRMMNSMWHNQLLSIHIQLLGLPKHYNTRGHSRIDLWKDTLFPLSFSEYAYIQSGKPVETALVVVFCTIPSFMLDWFEDLKQPIVVYQNFILFNPLQVQPSSRKAPEYETQWNATHFYAI